MSVDKKYYFITTRTVNIRGGNIIYSNFFIDMCPAKWLTKDRSDDEEMVITFISSITKKTYDKYHDKI